MKAYWGLFDDVPITQEKKQQQQLTPYLYYYWT
jgi:hypothetical protein